MPDERTRQRNIETENADEYAECCLTCRIRFQREAVADAHWRMTGHAMGWPMDEDFEAWPFVGDDRWDR